MSKKYSKWLVGAALLGAAAGAGLAYFKKHKKEKENWEDDFEISEDDFLDDDLEDFDGEDAADAPRVCYHSILFRTGGSSGKCR